MKNKPSVVFLRILAARSRRMTGGRHREFGRCQLDKFSHCHYKNEARTAAVKPMCHDGDNLLDPAFWENIPQDVQLELLRQGEESIKGTIAIAVAADQRAATTMGVCGAGGVGLLTASTTLIAGAHPDLRLICAATVTAFGFLLASVICAFAIAPTDFFIPGFNPARLLDSDAKQSELLRPTIINVFKNRIDHNRNAIQRLTSRYNLALAIAGAGIIAGIGFLILWVAAGAGRSF